MNITKNKKKVDVKKNLRKIATKSVSKKSIALHLVRGKDKSISTYKINTDIQKKEKLNHLAMQYKEQAFEGLTNEDCLIDDYMLKQKREYVGAAFNNQDSEIEKKNIWSLRSRLLF